MVVGDRLSKLQGTCPLPCRSCQLLWGSRTPGRSWPVYQPYSLPLRLPPPLPAVEYAGCLCNLATLLCVAQQPKHSQFRECLEQPQLCSLWADLLLPTVAAAAVGLGLAAERRLPLHDWAVMHAAASVLTSPMLESTLQQLTDAAGRDSSSPPEAATLARLVTSAAALVQLHQPEAEVAHLSGLLALLGTAANWLCQAIRQAGDRRRQTHHAEQLRAALPPLARALQQAVADTSSNAANAAVTTCNVLQLLQDAARQPGAISTLSDIEVWAAAAGTALCMLPAAAEAARQRPAELAAGQQDISFVATQLADGALDFALAAVRGFMDAANNPARRHSSAPSRLLLGLQLRRPCGSCTAQCATW